MMWIICKCGQEEEVPEDISLEHMSCMACGRTGNWMEMEIDEDGSVHLP